MSYENVPKNLTEKAVLVRDGRPDYFKLDAAAFPSPTLDEAGAILEVTDTGDRHRWSGTDWYPTEKTGERLVSDLDALAQMVLNTAQLLANKTSNDTKLDTIADKIINNGGSTAVVIEELAPIEVNIVSPLETSDRGDVAIPVISTDQTTDMLDLVFLEVKVTGLTLNADTAANLDLRVFTLAAAHGLTNANSQGHYIELADDITGKFIQTVILDITGDVVTVRQPIGRVFLAASTSISTGNPNMVEDAATGVVIDGSSTPVIFTVKPVGVQAGDITRIIMASISDNTSDYTTFGGADALDVGITLRKKRADATYKNLYTYVNNRDFVLHGFDEKADTPKATGNATFGRASRITFSGQDKHGVAERLDAVLNEELQIVISELMISGGANGNTEVRFIAEGHELQG